MRLLPSIYLVWFFPSFLVKIQQVLDYYLFASNLILNKSIRPWNRRRTK